MVVNIGNSKRVFAIIGLQSSVDKKFSETIIHHLRWDKNKIIPVSFYRWMQ